MGGTRAEDIAVRDRDHRGPLDNIRRIALDRMRAQGMSGEKIPYSRAYKGFGIRDGHGVMFVSNTGEICPAGFLPIEAGNDARSHCRCVSKFAAVLFAARSHATSRPVRRVRISRVVRRVPRKSVRSYRESSGVRSVLRVLTGAASQYTAPRHQSAARTAERLASNSFGSMAKAEEGRRAETRQPTGS